MSPQQHKAIVRRFFEASDAHDLAAFEEVLAPDLIVHYPGAPGPLDRETFLQMGGMMLAAFSDRRYTIEDQIAEGDRVATRVTWRAVHSGDFQGVPPTGKRVEVGGITVERIEGGKIAERWVSLDQLGMMQQLGLVPAPGQGGEGPGA